MPVINFNHKLAAHCESGMVTSLLNHSGIEISEAMVFGISGSIFFAYINNPMLPFPTIAVRSQPGKIYKNFSRHSNLPFTKKKFRHPDIAKSELENLLNEKTPAGAIDRVSQPRRWKDVAGGAGDDSSRQQGQHALDAHERAWHHTSARSTQGPFG